MPSPRISYRGLQRRRTTRRRWNGDSGLTLVEMLVALFILGVIFSAAAGALISFSQVAVNNERRVQSTALTNRLHEELQSLRWDKAVLYEDELDALDVRLNLDSTDPSFLSPVDGLDLDALTFDGLPLVTREGPGGCDVSDPTCRVPEAPEPYSDTLDPAPLDGRDYEVFRFVTWADRDGAAPEDLKRFTTIVRWTVLGRTIEQRVDSERAPTPAETSSGDASIQFLVQPSVVPLDDDYLNEVAISLTVDFTFVGSMDSAQVIFEDFSEDDQVITLTRVGLTDRFAGTIGVGSYQAAESVADFEDGQRTRQFLAVGRDADNVEYGAGPVPVVFIEPGGGGGGVSEITLTNPTVSPLSVTVGDRPGQGSDYRLCQSVTVSVVVTGAEEGAVIRTDYPTAGQPASQALSFPAGVVPIAGGTYTVSYTFPQYSDSPWRPAKPTGNGANLVPGPIVDVAFGISASNVGDETEVSIPQATEPQLAVQYATTSSGNCP